MISIDPLPYPSPPKVGRLHYRGIGYLASIISIDPKAGRLHYRGIGYLASIISIDLTLSFSPLFSSGETREYGSR